MNKKILLILIGIGFLSSFLTYNYLNVPETNQSGNYENNQLTLEISNKLDKIEEKTDEQKSNSNLTVYDPARTREWPASGPFQIDRNLYYLGEKIFININDLRMDEIGSILIIKPINSTHFKTFQEIPFDGSKKNVFNYYYEPKLSLAKNICNVNELLGEWQVIFINTNYPPINFQVINQTIPGDENKFGTVC